MGAKEYTFKNPEVTWASFPDPCYSPQGKYGKCPDTLFGVLQDDRIPKQDRIWAFCNCTEVSGQAKRLFVVRSIQETEIGNGKFVIDLITDKTTLKAIRRADKDGFTDEVQTCLESTFDFAMEQLGCEYWEAVRDAQLQIIISMIEP